MRLRYRYFSVRYGGKPSHPEQVQRGNWNWLYPMPYARQEVWRPPTDVYETDEHFVVMMELAGVREEDMEVTLFDDVLVVVGAREHTARPERVRYREMGINFGRFRSEVFLPVRVDAERVHARYENGFLSIWLPKCCRS